MGKLRHIAAVLYSLLFSMAPHPTTAEARSSEETEAWDKAKAAGTIEAMQSFIESHHNSPFAGDAFEEIVRMETTRPPLPPVMRGLPSPSGPTGGPPAVAPPARAEPPAASKEEDRVRRPRKDEFIDAEREGGAY
jgi:hypothetical protein